MVSPDRADALIAQARALPAEQRSQFLDTACQGDDELRARVESALADPEPGAGGLPRAGEELPTSTMLTPPPPAAGDPRGSFVGHYEIQERLGRGGMGVVYKALDTRLHRTVALKFLQRALSEEANARARFFAEARSASALDHNNICTVHEVGETDDRRIYIVMAHYEGQTLSELLGSGRLPLDTAVDYGVQIAAGLAAAHAKGILHRDMKPANVIVTAPDPGAVHGTPKILDFGLAKTEGQDLTRTGTTLGTMAYMSPEQAAGEEVDQRSDIWSFGVVLYEMLTGSRPFAGKTEVAALNALMTAQPVPLREIDPEIPEELETLVLKCLEKDRERRFTGVEEVLGGLRQFQAVTASYVVSGVLDTAPAAGAAAAGRRRLARGAAAALLVLLALALALPRGRQLLLRPLLGTAAPPARLVAVLPFINSLGATAENQALADGLTHSLTAMIARLGTEQGSLWIVPANEIIQQGVTTAGDARKLFGVDTVLTGSVQRIGPMTEIVLSLIDPGQQPPRTLDSRTLPAPLSPALRNRAFEELAALLGVKGAVRSLLAEADDQAVSSAAYTLYLQGTGFLQRYEKQGNVEAAIGAFEGSLEEDSRYGPAHAGLCEALWQRFRQTDDAQLTARSVASCERAAELAADEAAVLVTVGRIYFEMGENRRARVQLTRALEVDADSAEAHRWLGRLAFAEGRMEAAEAGFRKAIELEPRLWIYHFDFGETLTVAGRYEEAIELFEESRRLTPENYMVHNALGVSRNELNQVEAAEKDFRRSIELQPSPMAYRNLGYLHFREQRFDQAVENLENARDLIAEAPSFNDWIVWSWLGHAYHWAGDRDAARAAWQRLIEIATSLYEVNPRSVDVLMLLSDAHAALGDFDSARFYQSRLLALPIEAVYVRYYIGRTYEMMGDRELAFEYITRALEERFDPLTVDRDPWLAELREEPGYQVLRQQFMPSVGETG